MKAKKAHRVPLSKRSLEILAIAETMKDGSGLVFSNNGKQLTDVTLSKLMRVVERLIGTLRRECLDQTLFWNKSELQRKLDNFKDYYNHDRTHQAHDGLPPLQKAKDFQPKSASLKDYSWTSHCNGMFYTPTPT